MTITSSSSGNQIYLKTFVLSLGLFQCLRRYCGLIQSYISKTMTFKIKLLIPKCYLSEEIFALTIPNYSKSQSAGHKPEPLPLNQRELWP